MPDTGNHQNDIIEAQDQQINRLMDEIKELRSAYENARLVCEKIAEGFSEAREDALLWLDLHGPEECEQETKPHRMLVACNYIKIGKNPAGQPAAIVAVAPAYNMENAVEYGFDDLWAALGTAEEIFDYTLCLSGRSLPAGPGLWVYEREDFNEIDPDNWRHLAGGDWRLPTARELAALSKGKAPWTDGRLV